MMTVSGLICLVFGLIVMIGQLISTLSFEFAQQLGLQEKDDETEPLFRQLELNTARWDLFVLWTTPAAGILILANHPWWPYLALVAGAIYVDTAGREMAKVLGLSKQGVKTGSRNESRLYFFLLALMFLLGVWCITLGFITLV